MPDPILITGHERSGTTLLRRLVSMHPDLDCDLLHECWSLQQFRGPEDAMARYQLKVTQAGRVTGAWASVQAGEKIPYGENLPIAKRYISLWKRWWPESLVFHIVRQVDDVVDSCWRTFKIRTNNRTVLTHVEKMTEFLRQFRRVVAVDYDLLVAHPEHELRRIYSLMGRIPDQEYMHNVLHTQETWRHNGRIMCGLRYKPYVGRDR